jgi:N-acetylglucosamine kinase-like BadF-type ATPase
MPVLGIDVGGAKTVCLLADLDGAIVATSLRGAGANLQAVGPAGLETVLRSVIDETLGDRGITPSAVCLGVAGMDRAEDEVAVRQVMTLLGYEHHVLVVNDALIALVAAVGDAPGVVIVAGTGSMAYGRNAADHAARAGGWGYVLGDEGSGYWIGRLALRAVVRHADTRGPATRLTPRLLTHFGVERPSELIRKVYHERLSASAIASLAHYVQEARDEGDAVAADILTVAARELTTAAIAVVTRLGLTDEAFTFVLSGGIFRGVPWLRDQLTRALPAVAPKSTTVHLQKQPAVGAVRLALSHLRGGARVPAYQPAIE